jgi:hypothetical protein
MGRCEGEKLVGAGFAAPIGVIIKLSKYAVLRSRPSHATKPAMPRALRLFVVETTFIPSI